MPVRRSAESCGINNSMLNCVNYAILFSTVAVPFYIPISNAQVSLLHISPTLLSCVLFSFGNSHPHECEVVSCGFVCFSWWPVMLSIFMYLITGYFHMFFGDTSTQILCPCFELGPLGFCCYCSWAVGVLYISGHQCFLRYNLWVFSLILWIIFSLD